jgi:hypothetical protein
MAVGCISDLKMQPEKSDFLEPHCLLIQYEDFGLYAIIPSVDDVRKTDASSVGLTKALMPSERCNIVTIETSI